MIQNFLKNRIIAHLPFTPNAGQEQLIGLLANFLSTPAERPCFVLRGYAGTGKSSIVGALVKALEQLRQSFVLMSPTGRAAKVLARYANHQALTIHKQIYRRQQQGSDAFNLGFNNLKDTLFVIDEASMLSAERDNTVYGSGSLLDDLIRYVYMQTGNRLLLIGDDAQLPPVGHEESPALNPDFLAYSFHLSTFTFQLTEVARQAEDSGILVNATRLREEKRLVKMVPSEDFFLLQAQDMSERIEASYREVGVEETLIITRSNNRTNLYNWGIRAQLLYFDDILATGDRIMVSRNNSFQTQGYDDIPFLANGDMLEVIRLRNRHEMYGFEFIEAELKSLDHDWEINAMLWLDTLLTPTPEDSYRLQRELYMRISEDYPEIRNKRERNERIQASPYYNALQIRYAYAVTCHKAQGGQWKHVFVDPGPNFFSQEEQATDYRWLYTALTRATEQLFLLSPAE